MYQSAGASIAKNGMAVISQSKIIATVHDLPVDAVDGLSSGQIVVGMLDPYRNTQLDTYAAKGVTAFAMELLPRTLSRAQKYGYIVITSQSCRL